MHKTVAIQRYVSIIVQQKIQGKTLLLRIRLVFISMKTRVVIKARPLKINFLSLSISASFCSRKKW